MVSARVPSQSKMRPLIMVADLSLESRVATGPGLKKENDGGKTRWAVRA
jgi:hypothetical protein